jgi:hypothetical protein
MLPEHSYGKMFHKAFMHNSNTLLSHHPQKKDVRGIHADEDKLLLSDPKTKNVTS